MNGGEWCGRDEYSRFDLLVCLSDGKPSAGSEMGNFLMENTSKYSKSKFNVWLHKIFKRSKSGCTFHDLALMHLLIHQSYCLNFFIPLVHLFLDVFPESWDDFKPVHRATVATHHHHRGFHHRQAVLCKSSDQIFENRQKTNRVYKSSDLALQKCEKSELGDAQCKIKSWPQMHPARKSFLKIYFFCLV